MDLDQIARLTPHQDINDILVNLTEGIGAALGDALVAFWLTGSLTYGDFDRGSSDIDYLVVLEEPVTTTQRVSLAALHAGIGKRHPVWRERIEGSYITRDMLPSIMPPKQGRPYVNGGAFWDPDPPYGNEWLLNLYVLSECGVALIGPAPADLIGPVQIADVREASKCDLVEEWLPSADDPAAFGGSHFQAYVTLTLCRILHRATHDGVASKRTASAWVKETYGEPWRSLVERAERWSHGFDMNSNADVRAFIRFTVQTLDGEAPCSAH
ncbi:MAG: DUF4111 domain-containing protein [Chloroflexia bacterium]|nr:DUF4111 domain-containing protein [Chloroflexia bacterium]